MPDGVGLQHVVVVGGGSFGVQIAKALSSRLNPRRHKLTLVSSRPFYIHYPAALRALVTSEGDLEHTMFIPYDNLFSKGVGEFLCGTVSSISRDIRGLGGVVNLEDGSALQWDALILAPGNTWEGGLAFSTDIQDAEDQVREWRYLFNQSHHIVLVGGGAVGIELAGEIRDVYPRKRITIVHARSHLLNESYPLKFRRTVEYSMTSRGIRMLLSSHVDKSDPDSTNLVTREGVAIPADLVVPTRGGKPNTIFVRSLGHDRLTTDGFIRVDTTLQVIGERAIFAAGDATDIPEQKQLFKAQGHAEVIVENVLSVLQARHPKKEYRRSPEAIVITNGKKRGRAYFDVLWGLSLGNWFASTAKGKSLFLDKARVSMGIAQ